MAQNRLVLNKSKKRSHADRDKTTTHLSSSSFFFLEKTGETEDEERMEEEEETEGVLDKGEDGSNGQPRDTDNASCTESLALASAT